MLPSALHRRLKMAAAAEGTPLKTIAHQALTAWLEARMPAQSILPEACPGGEQAAKPAASKTNLNQACESAVSRSYEMRAITNHLAMQRARVSAELLAHCQVSALFLSQSRNIISPTIISPTPALLIDFSGRRSRAVNTLLILAARREVEQRLAAARLKPAL